MPPLYELSCQGRRVEFPGFWHLFLVSPKGRTVQGTKGGQRAHASRTSKRTEQSN